MLLHEKILRIVEIAEFADLSVIGGHCDWLFSITTESKDRRALINHLISKSGTSYAKVRILLANPNDPIGRVS